MREISVAEQRYEAVRVVLADGETVTDVEVMVARLRRAHPSWGPRRLVFELVKAGVEPVPSESEVYRALTRLGLVDPEARWPREKKWKGWERGSPMELWQMDVVGGLRR